MRFLRQARGKQSHPTREGLNKQLAVRAELYICRPPTRIKVPILVQPEAVKDDVLTEAESELAVQGMKFVRAGGPFRMIAEDLKEWRNEDKREK